MAPLAATSWFGGSVFALRWFDDPPLTPEQVRAEILAWLAEDYMTDYVEWLGY